MTAAGKGGMVINPHGTRVVLAHGGGGQLTEDLLNAVIRPKLTNAWLAGLDDSAVLEVDKGRMAFTTDSYVVQPLEFPGGDIGRLAVSGTVNDLAVCGATPEYLSLGLILEEGLELAVLERVIASAARTAEEAGVRIVTATPRWWRAGSAMGCTSTRRGWGGCGRIGESAWSRCGRATRC